MSGEGKLPKNQFTKEFKKMENEKEVIQPSEAEQGENLEEQIKEVEEAEEIPQEDKTSQEIKSLQAQKEHWREKAQNLAAEISELKEKMPAISVEKELENLYPDWEMMSPLEKELARKNLVIEKRLNKIEQGFGEIREEAEKEKQINNFLEKAKLLDTYSDLDEKAFREFAKKPENKNVSLDVLVKAFLFEAKSETPPVKKGSVLEKGSGGPKETPKKQMTPEELRILRERDPKKWQEIITKHPNWIPSEF